MSPIGAAIYIETQIKPKLTVRYRPPPAPLESVRGSGHGGKLGGKGLAIEKLTIVMPVHMLTHRSNQAGTAG